MVLRDLRRVTSGRIENAATRRFVPEPLERTRERRILATAMALSTFPWLRFFKIYET